MFHIDESRDASEFLGFSDNEEGQHPFELKRKDGDRTKVSKDDVLLGNVRCPGAAKDTAKVEDKSGAVLFQAGACSAALGVLLLDPIPETERYILLGELWARGM